MPRQSVPTRFRWTIYTTNPAEGLPLERAPLFFTKLCTILGLEITYSLETSRPNMLSMRRYY